MSAHSRSIITLTLLNGYIRAIIDKLQIPFETVPPTQWKKKMIGNGQASKDVVIDSWIRLDPRLKDIKVKIDDICDAGFLSVYTSSK